MPQHLLQTPVEFVERILNHEHQSWVNADNPSGAVYGFICSICSEHYLIALETFRFQGSDLYSNRLRQAAAGKRENFLETVLTTPCSHCERTTGVRIESSRTAYDTSRVRTRFERILEPDPPDPNIDVALCPDCSEEHKEYWDEMWSHVYGG
jgi:hypothetical protein